MAGDRETLAAAERELAAQREQLAQQQEELASQRAELEVRSKAIDDRLADLAAQREQLAHRQTAASAASQPAAPADLPVATPQDSPDEEPPQGEGSAKATVDEDAIFARLRNLALLKEEGLNESAAEPGGGKWSPQERLDRLVGAAMDAQPDGNERSTADDSATESFSVERAAELSIEHGAAQEVAARYHAQEQADEEAEEQADEEAADESAEDEAESQHAAARPGHHKTSGDGEDELIDDYMAQLLNRVRNAGGKPRAVPRHDVPTYKPTAPLEPAKPVAPARPAVEAGHGMQAVQMTPRGAPPVAIDLAAMRELANMQTHLAITRHKMSFRRRRATERCMVTLVTTGSAVALSYLSIGGQSEIYGYAAVVAWIVSIWSGTDTALTIRHVLRDRELTRQRQAKDNEPEETKGVGSAAGSSAAEKPQG